MERIRNVAPNQATRLRVGKHQPVPARLRTETRDWGLVTAVGPCASNPIDVGTVAKLAFSAARGDLGWNLLILDEAWQSTLAEFAPPLGAADHVLLVGDPG